MALGVSRSIAMLWRIQTPAADEALVKALADPNTALAAMSALRRRFGNADARPYIAPLVEHPDPRVRRAAKQQLRRIDKLLTAST